MNAKILKIILLLFTTTLFFGCSSDDNSNNNSNDVFGSITFNAETYDLKRAWIYDENMENDNPSDIGFNFTSSTAEDIESGNDQSNIVSIYFDFTEINLQEITYTEILDYNISVNGTYINEVFTEGDIILTDAFESELNASSSSVTIINLTDSTVNMTFSFTRNDGQVITGNYNGIYTVPEL